MAEMSPDVVVGCVGFWRQTQILPICLGRPVLANPEHPISFVILFLNVSLCVFALTCKILQCLPQSSFPLVTAAVCLAEQVLHCGAACTN